MCVPISSATIYSRYMEIPLHGAVPGLEGSRPAKRREGGPDNFDKNEK